MEAAPKRILIVDDDEMIRRLLSRVLENEYGLAEAVSGEQALQMSAGVALNDLEAGFPEFGFKCKLDRLELRWGSSAQNLDKGALVRSNALAGLVDDPSTQDIPRGQNSQ